MRTHIFYAKRLISNKGETLYWHPCPDRRGLKLAYQCQDSEIVKVKATEREDQTLPKDGKETTYIGWRKTGQEVPIMIQPCFMLFEIQFTYGVEAEVERGRGEIVVMDFEEIEDDADENKDRGVEEA